MTFFVYNLNWVKYVNKMDPYSSTYRYYIRGLRFYEYNDCSTIFGHS